MLVFGFVGVAWIGHAGLQAQMAGIIATRLPVQQLFTTSAVCQGCHNGLITSAGEGVSIGFDWRSSMMANAARDPYWQATVRREIIDHAPASAAIQSECSRCHMPMSNYRERPAGEEGSVFSHLPIGDERFDGDRDAHLAADGVGCATCHQILPDNFGERESFVGHFLVDEKTAWDQRSLIGPFEIDSGRTRIMHSASAFFPEKGTHIQESELCATCHTLITHALDENHEAVGELPEQVPYLEWLHSDYAETKSCQSCHMPALESEVAITSVLGEPREEVNRHAFRGGNFLIPRMLNAHRNELGVEALSTELDASALRTIDHLKASTASLTVREASVSRNELTAQLEVRNRAGHKLPTAYPSRRVWLHISVADRQGNIVFESGKLNRDGSIEGNANDESPDAFESHYEVIDAADKVQIYESIMLDSKGNVTTGITSGASYAKDNRLLPAGFDKATASSDIAVHGRARQDRDFEESGDLLRVEIPVPDNAGPFEFVATLWYQPIGARWAQNLAAYDADETARFGHYFDEMADNTSVKVAETHREIVE